MANQCFECQHWEGPKELARLQIEEHGEKSVSLDDGWVESGSCAKFSDWGDMGFEWCGCSRPEVAPGFGCVLWEKEETKK